MLLEWLREQTQKETDRVDEEINELVSVGESLNDTRAQLVIVKDSIEPIVDETVAEARRLAQSGEIQGAFDTLVSGLGSIRDTVTTAPVSLVKELEKISVAISTADERKKSLIRIYSGYTEKDKYYKDLESRIKSGEVDDSSPTPGKRRRGRKPGTKPDKLKDVRRVKAKIEKESKLQSSEDKE